MSYAKPTTLNWQDELNKTMMQSLVNAFGLDFLLMQDKTGGNVDTIQNARQGVWATQEAAEAYQNRGAYDSKAYHQDSTYIQKGRQDKQKHQDGTLYDSYRDRNLRHDEKRQLDHTISAHEIHNDAGRVLAGLDGVKLANQDSNLNSTSAYLNNLKRNHSMEKFVNEIAPNRLNEINNQLAQDKATLSSMPTKTPEQRHKKRELEDKIKSNELKQAELKEVIEKKDSLLKADKEAREDYNRSINVQYYTSSKFLQATVKDASMTGLKMGQRQALGLIFAEIWFEFRDSLTRISQKIKHDFKLGIFLEEAVESFKNIVERVKNRFKDLIAAFKDGFVAGAISSITTTLINIFATTAKNVVRLLRETYVYIVQAVKLVFKNPDNLPADQLMKEVFRILGTAVSVILGIVLNESLSKFFASIPFGVEIATFVSALASGVLMIGLNYMLDYSKIFENLKKFFDKIKDFFSGSSPYQQELKAIEELNRKLAEILIEIGRIEFNIDPVEIDFLVDSLLETKDEYERGKILKDEVDRRGIDLPFEMNNLDSVRNWLDSL